ncbi:MAG: PqiC family protein [Gammaproteobacteria bacterium]
MMLNRMLRASCVLLIALTAGCGSSPPSHFYTLDATATPRGAPSANYTVAINPVSIPTTVDRPQFVVQAGPNQVDVDEFNRWAGPLNESIARAVAGDLATLLGTAQVVLAPPTIVEPDYRVTVNVQRFEAFPGKSVLVDAVWVVRTTKSGATRSGHTLVQEPVQSQGFDSLAAGYSRALAKVSNDIAAAIRAESVQQP